MALTGIKIVLLCVSLVLFLAVYFHAKETRKTERRLMLELPSVLKGLLSLNVFACFFLFFAGIVIILFNI